MVNGIRFHSFKAASRANGPGLRCVVWFQGCTLNCGGCGNPETHQPDPEKFKSVSDVKNLILDAYKKHHIEGITFSGGEPLQQAEALIELMLFANSLGLSVIISTGYTFDEIAKMNKRINYAISHFSDVVIAGRYDNTQHIGTGFRGSANKEYRFFSEFYHESDFRKITPFEIEINPETFEIELTGVGLNPQKLEEILT